jgi:hypothetical protein
MPPWKRRLPSTMKISKILLIEDVYGERRNLNTRLQRTRR